MKIEGHVAELRAKWDGTDPMLRAEIVDGARKVLSVLRVQGPRIIRAAPEALRQAVFEMGLRVFKEEVSPFGCGAERAIDAVAAAFPELTKALSEEPTS